MAEEKTIKINYTGNSKASKVVTEEEPAKEGPKFEPIEGLVVTERKKSLGRKVAETFKGDSAESVGSYILFEVLIPAGKNALSDAVSQGVERMLFGSSSARPGAAGRSRTGYTAYNRVGPTSKVVSSDSGRDISRSARANHDFSEISLPTRGQAEEVIERLRDVIEEFGWVTVSDYYELVGITGTFQDNKWGWNDLREARVRPVRNGYLVELPRTQQID